MTLSPSSLESGWEKGCISVTFPERILQVDLEFWPEIQTMQTLLETFWDTQV